MQRLRRLLMVLQVPSANMYHTYGDNCQSLENGASVCCSIDIESTFHCQMLTKAARGHQVYVEWGR